MRLLRSYTPRVRPALLLALLMAAAAPPAAAEERDRSRIPEKYRWNLADIIEPEVLRLDPAGRVPEVRSGTRRGEARCTGSTRPTPRAV
jgi:hypothetical protein